MPQSTVKIEIGDLDTTAIHKKLGNKRLLFTALGAEFLKEVGRNFEAGGIWGKWAPLKPGTILGRRAGASSKPLQASGKLRASFRMEPSESEVRVGSPLKIAKYHHEGRGVPVGKPKWEILPRKRKALAFPAAGGRPVGSKEAFKSYGHKRRSAKFLRGTPMAVVMRVMHPGYPSRPLLPPQSAALKLANEVITALLFRGN